MLSLFAAAEPTSHTATDSASAVAIHAPTRALRARIAKPPPRTIGNPPKLERAATLLPAPGGTQRRDGPNAPEGGARTRSSIYYLDGQCTTVVQALACDH